MNEKELNDLLLESIRKGEISLEVSDSVADHWLSTSTEVSDAVKLPHQIEPETTIYRMPRFNRP